MKSRKNWASIRSVPKCYRFSSIKHKPFCFSPNFTLNRKKVSFCIQFRMSKCMRHYQNHESMHMKSFKKKTALCLLCTNFSLYFNDLSTQIVVRSWWRIQNYWIKQFSYFFCFKVILSVNCIRYSADHYKYVCVPFSLK